MSNKIKISIIIPCKNSVDYIGQTIDSIINQNYENLELIIVDGNSNDGTINEINKRNKYITKIISEEDSGQYHAIKRGIDLSSGDVITWINSDDKYFSFTLDLVNNIFNKNPDINWISGQYSFLDKDGTFSKINSKVCSKSRSDISKGYFRSGLLGFLQQESMFFKKSLWDKAGGLDLEYSLAADYDLWIKFSKYSDLISVKAPFAGFRIHINSRSKIFNLEYEREVGMILKKHNINNSLLHFFKTSNKMINHLFRQFYFSKSEIIYFSFSRQKWLRKLNYRSASNLYINELFNELI